MKHIALYENNTISISYENAISEYIEEYEKQHGEIKIAPPRGGGYQLNNHARKFCKARKNHKEKKEKHNAHPCRNRSIEQVIKSITNTIKDMFHSYYSFLNKHAFTRSCLNQKRGQRHRKPLFKKRFYAFQVLAVPLDLYNYQIISVCNNEIFRIFSEYSQRTKIFEAIQNGTGRARALS